MTMTLQDAERQAREIIAGAATSPKEVLGLEKVLRGARRFGLARRYWSAFGINPDILRDTKL